MNTMPAINQFLLIIFGFIYWGTVNRRITFWELIALLALHSANMILNELQNISKALRK